MAKSFSNHFSLAFAYLGDAERALSQGSSDAARSLLSDAQFFAGSCTSEAKLAKTSVTVSEHLAAARAKREEIAIAMKDAVFKWCGENVHKYRYMKDARDALAAANLVPIPRDTLYDWIRQHKKLGRPAP